MSLDQPLSRRAGARRRVLPAALRHPPRLRLALLVVALVAALAGSWLWLRDCGLVKVSRVQVTGATSSDEGRIRDALEVAAREQSTLHVREDALRAAVSRFPTVADLRVRTEFPHGMTIEVVEHRAVAALVSGTQRTPVTGSGLVLTGVRPEAGLPEIRQRGALGARVSDRRTLAAVTVAAAAPRQLLPRIERAWWSTRGLTLDLRDGPPLIFGDADGARVKWLATAAVLADRSAAGATYLDVRVPPRVFAGGLAPVNAADTEQPGPDGGPSLTPDATPTPMPGAVPNAQP